MLTQLSFSLPGAVRDMFESFLDVGSSKRMGSSASVVFAFRRLYVLIPT